MHCVFHWVLLVMLSDAFLFKIQEIDIIYASFNAFPFCPSSNAAEHRAQHRIEPHKGRQTDRLQKALLFPDVLHNELSCWRQAESPKWEVGREGRPDCLW